MRQMSEIAGKDAKRLKLIAHRFDGKFSECFKDMLMRASIWSEPDVENSIFIKVLASNEQGNFVAYEGQYSLEEEEFYCNSRMSKAFISSNHMNQAVNALLDFVQEITQIKMPINKVMLDLCVRNYYFVKIGDSKVEPGSIDVHICSYLDQAKEDLGFVDARRVAGDDLASF